MSYFKHLFSFSLLVCFMITIEAQVIKAQVIDKETNETIPYVAVTIGENYGVVADGEGYFEIEIPKSISKTDLLKVISIGYKDLIIDLSNKINSKLYLHRDAISMDEVVITNSKYSLEEIIEKVEENISRNYTTNLTKKQLFFRQKDNNKINKLNIEFKKSTIPELNQDFVNKELAEIPKTSAFYTEVLADWYGDEDDYKLDIDKAVKFFDTFSNDYLEVLNKKLEEILNKNFKKDSYFKIKSGLFSIKTDAKEAFSEDGELLDMRNEMSKKEEVNKNFFFKNSKKTIKEVFEEVFYTDDTSLNFIKKPSRYDFELIDTIDYGEDLVYKINFFPNGREDFKGTFYVNTQDFAIVRIDYQNVAQLKGIKLLGFSYKELGRKGTMIFEKDGNEKYQLKFIEQVQEDKYGIDRPLKIIEKNKNVRGRKKQNEISSEIDFTSTVVREFQILVYDTKGITENQFNSQSENKKEQPKNWVKYYSGFWKGIPEGTNFKSKVKEIKIL